MLYNRSYISIDASSERACQIVKPDGRLLCQDNGVSIPTLGFPLNRTHQFQADDEHVLMVIDGQIIELSYEGRSRRGGDAQLLRPTPNTRYIQIDWNKGVDAPLCGTPYFKPCHSLKYALSRIESLGPWVTYQLAPAHYDSYDESDISYVTYILDYPGITIEGMGPRGSVTMSCQAHCFTIQSSGIRIRNIGFVQTRGIVSVFLPTRVS
jgi:hypothetical protein